MSSADFGARPSWEPTRPRLHPLRLLIAWVLSGVAVYVAAGLVPGIEIGSPAGALLVAGSIAVVNALLPPIIAALRLPFTLVAGFLLVLLANAAALVLTDELFPEALTVASFADALLGSIVIAGTSIVLQVLTSTNDDDEYNLRVVRRVAKRQGAIASGDAPGIIYLEIDGLALPILQAAMRNGSAPCLAKWIAEDDYRLTEWETDLSSQTGASQAGILLGSNEDIPAFRWVEKESGKMMVCSAPADCAEIERRRSTGRGLLADGGASRGNLLSGDADAVILTVSRIDAEKGANPGYRAFFANGFNVTRSLALFAWEVVLEWTAASRAKRRDVQPRGHRGGSYPFLRAGMCVVVRDLVVFGVLNDMMRGRPAIYATFASYDEVAHHSGLQQADTLEALRKLDQQFGRIAAARRYAPRPYEIVVLSDHGQTQGATFKQRNGYGLDELVEKSLAAGGVTGCRRGRAGGDAGACAAGGLEPRRRRIGRRPPPRSRDRPRVGQPGPDLPPGGQAATDAGGDRGGPSGADREPAPPPPHRLAARRLRRAWTRSSSGPRGSTASATATSSAGTHSPPSRSGRPRTSCARAASSTRRTSCSAASTTPTSTRPALSRS